MRQNINFNVGDEVVALRSTPHFAQSIVKNEIYTIELVRTCSCGKQLVNVGFKSKTPYIQCVWSKQLLESNNLGWSHAYDFALLESKELMKEVEDILEGELVEK